MSDTNNSQPPASTVKTRASGRTSHTDIPPDPRPPLTPRQRDVLEIIRASVKEKGYPPTVREICAKIGASSPHAAAFHLNELVRKGYLQHAGGKRSRTLTVVELTPNLEKTIPFRGTIS